MLVLVAVVVAIIVYGLGPDLNGDVAKDIYHVVLTKIKKLF